MDINNRINQYDGRSKEIISHKIIIAYIIKGVIPEFKDIPVEEIALDYIIDPNNNRDLYARIPGRNTEVNDDSKTKYRYDYVFDFILPSSNQAIMDIELQGDFYPIEKHINRAKLYISTLIENENGAIFTHDNYDQLEKVYGVWIYFNPPKIYQDSIYQLKPRGTQICGNFILPKEIAEFFSLTFIFLGNNDKIDSEILRLLDALFYKDISTEKRNLILKDQFKLDDRIIKEVEPDMSVGLGLYNSGKLEGKLERNLEIIHYIMKRDHSSLKEIMELLGIELDQYDYYNQLLQKSENSTDSNNQ